MAMTAGPVKDTPSAPYSPCNNITLNDMEKKKHYEAPKTDILELKAESFMCQSLTDPDDYIPGGDPFNV